MKPVMTLGSAIVIWMFAATAVMAESSLQQPQLVSSASHDESYSRQSAEVSPSDRLAEFYPAHLSDFSPASYSDGESELPVGDAHADDQHADHARGHGGDHGGHRGFGHAYDGHGCQGLPWTLKDYLNPCSPYEYGGWVQAGYHSDFTGQSSRFNDLHDFNDVPDQLNLHQAWLYFGKEAESRCCEADWGYRVDVLYGTDAQRVQAFGNHDAPYDPGFGNYDNSLDHGEYGWAIPQAYAELAYGDWTVKMGHFLSNIGYEKVPSVQNFFYSHSLTFESSVPFTYTGVVGEYQATERTSYQLGWALGWDTGYDQFGDGNIFIGGIHHHVTDDFVVAYTLNAGNFGFRSADQGGYSHSLEFMTHLTEYADYVIQSDYVYTEGSFDHADEYGEEVGIVQYLFYTLNDCWKLGGRVEWLKTNHEGEHISFYELTGGVNYRPHANVVIRPEIRYDWSPSTEFDPDYNREIFGIDAIFTF